MRLTVNRSLAPNSKFDVSEIGIGSGLAACPEIACRPEAGVRRFFGIRTFGGLGSQPHQMILTDAILALLSPSSMVGRRDADEADACRITNRFHQRAFVTSISMRSTVPVK